MIDILIPVLGRPHRAAPLVENIRAATTTPHRIVFLVTSGDTEQICACDATGADYYGSGRKAGPGDYALKINLGLTLTDSEWLFMGADDLTFHPGWDTEALRAAGDRFDVIATNDMANAQVKRGVFGTHCLIRRRYITDEGGTADNVPGLVLHEGYDHNFVDRELCHVAESRGRYAYAATSKVKHSHPLWRTAKHDATYEKALAKFKDDQQLFLSRAPLWDEVGLSDPERRMAARAHRNPHQARIQARHAREHH